MSRLSHSEVHMVHRIGWLRAAVLGANDGLVSTASLVVGVAAAGSGRPEILIAGLAGLVAGAMSMAAGEYVSVSSQTDAEQADIARETRELRETPGAELDELTRIYVARGLDDGLMNRRQQRLDLFVAELSVYPSDGSARAAILILQTCDHCLAQHILIRTVDRILQHLPKDCEAQVTLLHRSGVFFCRAFGKHFEQLR